MTKNEYNGWTNYETWNVALWIDNTQGDQEFWSDRAQEAFNQAGGDSTFTKAENATLDLLPQIEESFQETALEFLEASRASASWIADLLGAALSEVNWHEIAKHYIDPVAEKSETIPNPAP